MEHPTLSFQKWSISMQEIVFGKEAGIAFERVLYRRIWMGRLIRGVSNPLRLIIGIYFWLQFALLHVSTFLFKCWRFCWAHVTFFILQNSVLEMVQQLLSLTSLDAFRAVALSGGKSVSSLLCSGPYRKKKPVPIPWLWKKSLRSAAAGIFFGLVPNSWFFRVPEWWNICQYLKKLLSL